ncbi:hypothetical protein CcI156_18290 [Frankia sp. CcI156]|uniref:HTH cro/C1-type domain-containing protein n=1 Tax=Frankia casuarinae (strain DSM 45818 / CECT 9043 / HFP020203 / CcI3) TaxID=106370 RepID=Q2JBZ9_FRACC|nr:MULTISPECIES: hypothetical protein [Frankia]ABD11193.1 hypothetical protein Francci3_1817 [Frankia casuarinae]ETA00026.1 hypothetical protein CcI6DRAFT_04564 [Frankia sp. CcI6]EYT91204.1 hypothetical protein ThrDRAFT_03131 [Frankia casuarinae]KFB03268.1 hypothetical protein ALLO2DRAFT_03950 [Frankia sp. Allo2]OAA18651.1 hypothetical protein AAY23_11197 [Frankia casuarinae]
MGKTSQRVEQEELRARMRAVGMSHDEIATEFARRYSYRPRAAHRVAHGWTQAQAAGHINAHAARVGLDPGGAAPLTGPGLCERELWPQPNNRRRPTPQFLALLAEVYGTSIHNLIDLDDREQMPPADLLLISTIRVEGVPASAVGSLARTKAVDVEAPLMTALNRQQFLLAVSISGVAAVTPRQPAAPAVSVNTSRAPAGDDLLADLREAVTVPAEWSADPGVTSAGAFADLEARGRECHNRYQRADYAGAARLLPAVVRGIDTLVADSPAGVDHRAVRRSQAVAYIAAAKLATRTGDHDLAWLAADRGQHAALAADTPVLLATARRQIACVFHDTGRLADAERVALSALDALNRRRGDEDHPDIVSARGALLLLAAMTSVRQGERAQARRRLTAAAEQAGTLGRDDNRLWSAFGPTNVAIHTLTAALTLDDPTEAVAVGEQIDTRLLPPPLVGRRARLHLDLADGHARLGEDAVAAVHILDVARRAPQLLRVDPTARAVLATLLSRARGSIVSVLRDVAEQAGVAA